MKLRQLIDRAPRSIAPIGWDEVNPGGNEQADSETEEER